MHLWLLNLTKTSENEVLRTEFRDKIENYNREILCRDNGASKQMAQV
jgi:hypothetical protein